MRRAEVRFTETSLTCSRSTALSLECPSSNSKLASATKSSKRTSTPTNVSVRCPAVALPHSRALTRREPAGVLNSRLINAYCDLHPSIRPLCVFIKFWASQRDLNDPSGQAGPVTFSSYTLILLVIAYLQSISLVPNLQAADLIAQQGVERRRFFSTPKARIRRGKLNGIKGSTGWDTTFVEKVPGWEVQEVGLKELARGFFDYYGRQFQGEEEVVSIQNGAPFPRSTPFFTLLDELEAEVQQKATLGDGQVSTQEQRRQDAEDDLLADFAREVEREKDPTAAAAAEELERDEVKAASRSSSPFLYEEFDEPGIWSRRPLVVQDPFDLTRNTAGNIESDIMEAFQKVRR